MLFEFLSFQETETVEKVTSQCTRIDLKNLVGALAADDVTLQGARSLIPTPHKT